MKKKLLDKINALESLNRLFAKIPNPQLEEENDFYDICCVLKAFETIKKSIESYEIIIWKHKVYGKGWCYYCLGKPIPKEIYELMKEVLLTK